MRVHILIVSLALAAMPVAAQDATPKRYVDVPAGPANTKSKIICKNNYEIGSWVKKVRRCGTERSWNNATDAARFDLTRMRAGSGPMEATTG